MTPTEVLETARKWVKERADITYQMGGEDLGPNGKLDCSAFIWHVLGTTKKDRNTDWIRADALGKQTKFKAIDGPIPGCIAVYGTAWERLPGKPAKRHSGHVGIVADPSKKTVVDCSSGMKGIREHTQAVLFDGPKFGNRKVVFCIPV